MKEGKVKEGEKVKDRRMHDSTIAVPKKLHSVQKIKGNQQKEECFCPVIIRSHAVVQTPLLS